jgi:hypothetical protein
MPARIGGGQKFFGDDPIGMFEGKAEFYSSPYPHFLSLLETGRLRKST